MHRFFIRRFVTETGFLLSTCISFIVLRFPSLFEPYWYGDEGIYFTIGRAIRSGRALYSGIWDNKPPLLYWIYTICNDLFSVRFASLLFGMAAVIAFYFLARELFRERRSSYLATVIFALMFALPTIEGNIANAENFLLFPVITAAFFFLKALQRKRYDHSLLLASGILLGIAFLIKTVAIFDCAAFAVLLLFLTWQKQQGGNKLIALWRDGRPYLIGFITPFVLLCLLFLVKGILPEFLETIFLKNAGYVGEKNSLIIPQGYLIVKCLLLTGGLGLLFRLRKQLTFPVLFTLTWLSFSLFNAYFSQRPYVHYQLVLLPAYALGIGLLFSTLRQTRKFLLAILLGSILLLLYTTFPHWDTNKPLPYYLNFISFISGNKTVAAYEHYFDGNTPGDHAVADYIKLHTEPGETVFIWGDSAQIYYLSYTLPPGRYAAAYHIVNAEAIAETAKALQTNPPKFVMIMRSTEPFPFSLPDYEYRASIADTTIYEKRY
jgi:4-amino-4-deoxy-L-arabinose transferase-like glycosyltransferase